MIINKAYKFRIYPSKKQKELLEKHFGCCRFVYNYFLRKRIDFYTENKSKEKRGLTYYDTSLMLTQLRNQREYIWLKDVNCLSLHDSLRNLDSAYNNFFNKKSKFPKFKKKNNYQSFKVRQDFKLDLEKEKLSIPKFSPIKIVVSSIVEGRMKSITISKTFSGKYFASILCEIEKTIVPKTKGKQIGIDLGIKSFLVTSNNEIFDPPKFFHKSESQLKKSQRILSRRKKGSNRRNKARLKVAILHEKITNQRKDFLHKLSNKLISENQAIYVEDLNVKGMMSNHHLAKSIFDCRWSEFLRQLEYKAKWNGVYFKKIDRFFPSSKRCSSCGWINDNLSLKDREWICQCGKVINRDLNAAQNILLFGKNSVGCGTPKPKRLRREGVVKPLIEAGISIA